MCVFGGRSGFTRSATGALTPIDSATAPQRVQFRLTFNIEQENAILEPCSHLRVGFANAGKDNFRSRSSRRGAPGAVSPPEVTSNPAPCSAINLQMLRLPFVLTL